MHVCTLHHHQAVETQRLVLVGGSPESWTITSRLVCLLQLFAAEHVVTHMKDENASQRVMEAHLEKLLQDGLCIILCQDELV